MRTKEDKIKWFRLPRWLVVTSCVVVLLIAGCIVATARLNVRPIDITPPPVTAEIPTPPEDVSLKESDEPPTQSPAVDKPPGLWDSYGRKEGVYTIVLAGTDMDGVNTDVLMVAALDVINNTLEVVNIPRDTQINVRRSNKKINSAWILGGIDNLNKELSSIIGFVPDTYAVVNLQGFEEIVDAIGGVDFDVPRDMYYNDPSQNLHISLRKGYQHLDGAKAIQMIRFRKTYPGGDYDRIPVTQDFLKAVAHQTLKLGNLFKIGEFAEIAEEHLKTGMDTGQIVWFLRELMKLDEEDIHFNMLPVDAGCLYLGLDYALVRVEDTLDMINNTINPYLAPRTETDLDVSQLWDTKRS